MAKQEKGEKGSEKVMSHEAHNLEEEEVRLPTPREREGGRGREREREPRAGSATPRGNEAHNLETTHATPHGFQTPRGLQTPLAAHNLHTEVAGADDTHNLEVDKAHNMEGDDLPRPTTSSGPAHNLKGAAEAHNLEGPAGDAGPERAGAATGLQVMSLLLLYYSQA